VIGALHADPLGMLVAFGAGMLSFLSPCVLPLVPGYVSMVSGLSAAELTELTSGASGSSGASGASAAAGGGSAEGEGRGTGGGSAVLSVDAPPTTVPTARDLRRERSRLLRGLLAFVAGFTVVFVILGAASSALGHLLLTHQRLTETLSGILIIAFGTLLVLMAAEVRLPMALVGERRLAVRPSMLGAWAPPVMGVAFAFAWTPCIGPVLSSVLAIAAGPEGQGTPVGGIFLLLAYSIGLGVPFLLCGLLFGRLTDVLARVRGRLRWVDLIGGLVLVAFGILLLTGNVAVVSHTISDWLNDLHLARLSVS